MTIFLCKNTRSKLILNKNTVKSASKNTQKINEYLKSDSKVILPAGKIYINDSINLNQNGNWLEGQGANTQLILLDSVISNVITINNDRCVVSNLMIIGNKTTTSTISEQNVKGHGISVHTAFRTIIDNVYIHDVLLNGINSDGLENNKSSLTAINNCTIERAGQHSIYHGPYSQDPMIVNTFTQDADKDGLVLNKNYGCVITNSHFYRNGINNVKIIGGGRHRFENCTLDHAKKWGVYLYHTHDITMSKNIIFDNNQSDDNTGGIYIGEKTYRCLIMQNTIYDDPPVTQDYGIYITKTAMDNQIVHNEVRNSIQSDYISENEENLIIYDE